ncbi:MAG: CsbD family protein [Phycisphaerales bacterium]
MTSDTISGNWKQFKGKVRQQWGKLTDDDMDVINGKREELEGKLQTLYGKDREQVRKEVDKFAKDCGCNW